MYFTEYYYIDLISVSYCNVSPCSWKCFMLMFLYSKIPCSLSGTLQDITFLHLRVTGQDCNHCLHHTNRISLPWPVVTLISNDSWNFSSMTSQEMWILGDGASLQLPLIPFTSVIMTLKQTNDSKATFPIWSNDVEQRRFACKLTQLISINRLFVC